MTEEEFRSGKLVDGTLLMQPAMSSRDYISQALVTLSPSFFGEKVSKAHFTGRINSAIDALNKLDQVKKSLFYGKDNNLDPPAGVRDVTGLNERVGGGGVNGANIIHAIIGVATEAGELLEALKADYNRDTANTMDSVNIREEVGDLFWYLAILAHEVGFDFENAMSVNIAKLRKRYPDKFSAFHANERDLAAERAILEDRAAPLVEQFAAQGPLATADVINDPNGGDYAPGFDDMIVNEETGESEVVRVPIIVSSEPASGKAAVERVAQRAGNAFGAILNVGNLEPPIAPTSDLNGELAKSIAERKRPMPQETMARSNAGNNFPLDPDSD